MRARRNGLFKRRRGLAPTSSLRQSPAPVEMGVRPLRVESDRLSVVPLGAPEVADAGVECNQVGAGDVQVRVLRERFFEFADGLGPSERASRAPRSTAAGR